MIINFKTFFNHIENSTLVEKKIFVKNFYYKYLIKTSVINPTTLDLSVDNFFSFQRTLVIPKTYANKKDLKAFSLNLKSYSFKSNTNSKCSFQIPILTKYESSFNPLKKISSLFSQSLNKLNAILLLRVIKGGFRIYSSVGILGFLPRSQLKRIISSANLTSKFLISSTFYRKMFYLFWILIKESKIKIRSFLKFKARKRKSNKKIYSNFVFFCEKKKK